MEEKEDQCSSLKPLELFAQKSLVKICAPMVRYSKLAFRSLVRSYDCDLAFTPMIVSHSFIESVKARDSEFTTNQADRPLIVQFAAKNAVELANAAEIVYPFSDGVDLNCGCPQRWAISEGYGAHLLGKPELLHDMIFQTRNRIPDSDFTVSMKIRILEDIRRTVDLCRQAEQAGLSWLTVHARTPAQRNEPVTLEAVKIIGDTLHIPVVLNGDVKSLENAKTAQLQTSCRGVMAARGLLENPAMFAGYKYTPKECIQKWVEISLSIGTPFTCFHHHLMYMLEHILPKSERRVFNTMTSTAAVLDYLEGYL